MAILQQTRVTREKSLSQDPAPPVTTTTATTFQVNALMCYLLPLEYQRWEPWSETKCWDALGPGFCEKQ
eukprot:1161573-Pelagomonas_calceolata.AAC.3